MNRIQITEPTSLLKTAFSIWMAICCLSITAAANTPNRNNPNTIQQGVSFTNQQSTACLQVSNASFDPIVLTIHTTGLSALELQSPARTWFHQVRRTFKRNLSLCGVFQLQKTPRAINFVTLHFQKNQDGKLQVNMTVQS
ncbi:MAG: hypothetical protein AAF320_05825, partial [Myxococcota bacterium]